MGFNIGPIAIKSKLVLAPMAGISNPSYIKIVEQMGVGLAFTELISAEAIIRNNEKTFAMLKGIEKIKIPVGVQLFGSNPESLAQAAQIITQKYPIKLIDINMGCPVPKVALKSGAGSALLKNPDLIRTILKKVTQAVDVPITVKIRSGWDKDHINALEIAKICEEEGVKALSIHARTRADGYTGKADWQIIKEVKEHVTIPIIGNGDVTSPVLAKKMFDETGCDAVMIGRAALGNPWLFKECEYYLKEQKLLPEPSITEKIAMLKKHYELLKENQNLKVALLEIKVPALAYLKGIPKSKELKEQIVNVKTEEEFLRVLTNYQKELNSK